MESNNNTTNWAEDGTYKMYKEWMSPECWEHDLKFMQSYPAGWPKETCDRLIAIFSQLINDHK